MHFFKHTTALAVAVALLLAYVAAVASSTATNAMPHKYIILLKPDTNVASIATHHHKVRSIHARNLGRRDTNVSTAGIERLYQMGNFIGYAGSFDTATIKEIELLPEVHLVEPDYAMELSAMKNQRDAELGLALLSLREDLWRYLRSGMSMLFRIGDKKLSTYTFDDSAGQGTFTYILDTGVRTTHDEIRGRAHFAYDALIEHQFLDSSVPHGTCIASIVGGNTYGVAKKTTLINVRVNNGRQDIDSSTVIDGYMWAVEDIVRNNRQNTAVILIAIAGPASRAWDTAITQGFSQGVLVVTGAGNKALDATAVSPCRSPEVICVGSMKLSTKVSRSSNFGPAVNIFAYGTEVLGAGQGKDNAKAVLSGTSPASAYVAGVVSYLRGVLGPTSAADIKAKVYEMALKEQLAVDGLFGAKNRVAHIGATL